MSRVEVAVIIVTYKSASLTIDCLRSIEPERADSGPHIRAIVVDTSTLDVPEIANAIASNAWSSWVTLIAATRNGGFAYGNNLGIEQARQASTPDYVLLLNPDTVVRQGAILALVDFLQKHPDVGIAGSGFENLDGTDWPIAFRFPSILSEIEQGVQLGIVSRLLRRWIVAVPMSNMAQPIDWVPGASMMIRRTVIDNIGGLDEGYFLYFEETDFCLRAKQAGFATWYVPKSRVMHIAGQSTKLTERNALPKRLPAYWFESRRRYFIKAHGVYYAMIADGCALVAHGFGTIKRFLQRRTQGGVPHFMRDLLCYSVLRSKNRGRSEIKDLAPKPPSVLLQRPR
jgi:hypothetical protein